MRSLVISETSRVCVFETILTVFEVASWALSSDQMRQALLWSRDRLVLRAILCDVCFYEHFPAALGELVAMGAMWTF